MGSRLPSFAPAGLDPATSFLAFPRIGRYAAADWQALRSEVDEARESLQLVAVTSRQQLLFDSAGRSAGGYRWSRVAFKRLCSWLLPGLQSLTYALLGGQKVVRLRNSEMPVETSQALAVATINSVLRLRGEATFDGWRLLVNVSTRTIEALVGYKFRPFWNAELLAEAERFADRHRPRLRPWAAELVGYDLRLLYLPALPTWELCSQGLVDTYRTGYYFTNADHGCAALCGGNLVVRDADGGRAYRPFPGVGYLRHDSLLRRLIPHMFRLTQEKRLSVDELLGHCHERQAEAWPRELQRPNSAEKRKDIVQALLRARLDRPIATAILERMVRCGDGPMRESDGAPAGESAGTRTMLGLFLSLGYEAQRRLVGEQELLGRLAFRALRGQLRL